MRLLLALCLMLVIPAAVYAKWKPEYAQLPQHITDWFKKQRNAKGEWCCDEADGHAFYGDVKLNPDGTVTLDGKITLPKYMILTGPNPMKHPIWWYMDSGNQRRSYCFALGPLG